jgi:DHA3 family macrolide efflux protein-like MFS transporter
MSESIRAVEAPEAPPPAVPPEAAPALDPELPAPAPMSMRAVLGITLMRRLWFAQIISLFGDFLVLFAIIGVLTFKLHATASQITGIQVAYLLPIAILGILAGVFVDRWPLKPTLISSDSIRAALVLLLLAATQLWHFYAILAAISVVSSFFAPAQGVAIRAAVPLHGLRSATALMQQVMFGMRILGPAVGAYLVATFGAISCYLADSASFAISALLIASVAFVQPPPLRAPAPAPASPGGPAGSGAAGLPGPPSPPSPPQSALGRVGADMKQGFSFIVHHAGLLFVTLALASGLFIIGCFGPLIAIYVRDVLHASTKTFGAASALIGIGMLVGINVIGVFAKNVKSSVLVYCGLAGIAVGLVGMVGVAWVWSTLAANFLIGMSVAGIVIPSQTMIQQETPPALMGRFGSTTMSLVFTAQISGLLLSGLLAAAIGVRGVFAACAVLVAVLVAAGRTWMEPEAAGGRKA